MGIIKAKTTGELSKSITRMQRENKEYSKQLKNDDINCCQIAMIKSFIKDNQETIKEAKEILKECL